MIMSLSTAVYVAVPCLYMFFDVNYFIRGVLVTLKAKWNLKRRGKRELTEESSSFGFGWTTDLDSMLHMNNSRYLRECDFGRFKLWIETGIWDAVQQLRGGMTLGASTIRYRRSIDLFTTYNIKTQVLCWDDKAFYVMQRFERRRDGFICAIGYLKQTVIKTTPAEVVQTLYGKPMESPEFPEEIQHWIQCNDISSAKLRQKTL